MLDTFQLAYAGHTQVFCDNNFVATWGVNELPAVENDLAVTWGGAAVTWGRQGFSVNSRCQ